MNGSFKFYLTDSLAASVGCFVDESLVEQTEAGERTSDSSHLPQDEHPLRVDVALGYGNYSRDSSMHARSMRECVAFPSMQLRLPGP